ncbi:MAG: glycosyltransferase family 4 protein [Steroidobacteraceae bacterium]
MKLALVVPGGVDRSGERRVIPALLALIERLSARHEVHVFALRQEVAPDTWMLRGAQVHNIGAGWTRTRAVRAILTEHRASRFDLVQSVFAGACGLVAVCAARLLRLPSVVHVAGGEPVSLPDIRFGGRVTWRGRRQESTVLAGATAITAASAPQIELLARLGVTARRVALGVDHAHDWPARAPVARCAGEPGRLIHVASLNRVKDQAMLLRAMARLTADHPGLSLDIVGEDTLGGEVQRFAAALGLGGQVCFHGFLMQRQLHPRLRQAHISVISSRHEAGPLVLLEAAAVGVPTVGTAVGHVVEWAPEAAVAVAVGDSAALAAALHRLLSDEPLRLRLAQAAWLRALREDADYTAACFEGLYAELVSPGR